MARRITTQTMIALGLVLVGMTAALADFPEDDIEVIIPYAAGGGFDSYVRGVLPYMRKYLPNDVNLIPRNMPGAGGRKGATAIFRARPDGYTIGAFNLPGLMLPEILGERVAYNLSEITWLGRLSEDQYLLVSAGSSGITSVADLRALGRPIKFTATGAGSSAHAASVIAARMLGLDASVITGYEGSQAYILAVVRGDGDVALGASNSIGSYTATGDLRVIASLERSSSYPDAQTPEELGIPDLSQLTLQRMLGAPPNLDPEARAVLVEALANALADEELISWSESIGLPFAPLSAEEAAANITNQRALYEQFKDFL